MKIDFDKYPLPSRMRHHTAPNLYMSLSELKEKPDYYPPMIHSADWNEIFADGNPPQILDVGCGKGKLLLDSSEKYPGTNVLGIEVRKLACEWISGVIEGEGIGNCAVFWYSVVNGLNFIMDNSVREIYYLFPDPWPKKKHHKRRAFNELVLAEFFRVLQPGGKLFLATDVPEVHEYHLEILNQSGNFTIRIILNDDDWGLPITNKETFCRKNDISFDRIICTK
jgi:tRNA (guanine-N7-)-methyltransferase